MYDKVHTQTLGYIVEYKQRPKTMCMNCALQTPLYALRKSGGVSYKTRPYKEAHQSKEKQQQH